MPAESATLAFEAIGTGWQVDSRAPIAPDTVRRMYAVIEDFDRTWSRFRPDSLVTEVAGRPGEWTFPDEAPALVELYSAMHAATEGAMSPLVGASLSHLGYGAGYSLVPGSGTLASPAWDRMDWDGTRLSTRQPVELDIGAAGKGLLVDLIVELLEHAGVEQIVVDASGDLRHSGGEPVRVALEHPYDTDEGDRHRDSRRWSLCAPRRAIAAPGAAGLHHVLDARTGQPVDEVVATWVTAETAMVADAVATALFFTAADQLAALRRLRARAHAHRRASRDLGRIPRGAVPMRRLLDSSLGRVSGYRLMTLSLGAIAVVAFILSATGLLFYTPDAVGASASSSPSAPSSHRAGSPDASCARRPISSPP